MKLIFPFIVLLLLGCNSKTISNNYKKIETIDTTIRVFNDLKPLKSKTFLFDVGIIENDFFKITTSYDKKSGQIETVLTPKKIVEIPIKKIVETTTEKIQYSNNKKSYYGWWILMGILFGCILYIKLKK